MPEPPDISESKENRSRFKTDFYAAIHHDFGSVTYDYVAGDDLARMDNIAPDGGYFFTRITDKKNKTLLLPAVDGEYWLGAIAVMVAYRMMDGATVANSELMIFASDGGERGRSVRRLCGGRNAVESPGKYQIRGFHRDEIQAHDLHQ